MPPLYITRAPYRLLALAVILLLLGILCQPFSQRGGQDGAFANGMIQKAHAAESCEQPVNRFRGGPGRRPGSTAVLVSIREQIQDDFGPYVFASSDETVALVTDDLVNLRVILSNHSIYDVGNVEFTTTYRAPAGGVRPTTVDVISGATYDPLSNEFLVPRIPKGESVTVHLKMFFPRPVGEGLYQHKVILKDYVVLESERRFTERTPETDVSRSRTTIEKMGIDGTDVVCFSASTAFRQPVRSVEGTGGPGNVPLNEEGEEPPIAIAEPEMDRAAVRVQKSASSREVRPGMTLKFRVTVVNDGSQPLTNVLIDDRFSQDKFMVMDAGGGQILGGGIQWVIDSFAPGDRWFTEYTVRVSDDANNGDRIPSTVRVVSQNLIGTPTGPRSDSHEIVVIAALPQAGSFFSATLTEIAISFFLACILLSLIGFALVKSVMNPEIE